MGKGRKIGIEKHVTQQNYGSNNVFINKNRAIAVTPIPVAFEERCTSNSLLLNITIQLSVNDIIIILLLYEKILISGTKQTSLSQTSIKA